MAGRVDSKCTFVQSSMHADPGNVAVREASAVRIQRIARGFLARRELGFRRRCVLPMEVFEEARSFVDMTSDYTGIPIAPAGLTRVYFPPEITPPVVLKMSGPDSSPRVDQMMAMRKVSEKHGLGHLVIPKARVHGDCIIEERLPLGDVMIRGQLGLYRHYRAEFTPAIQDLTRFAFHVSIEDMDSGKGRERSYFSGIVPRYDNFPLYIDRSGKEPRFRIGLIDLEECMISSFEGGGNSLFEGGGNSLFEGGGNSLDRILPLIALFPHHLDEIMEVAKEFDPNVERYRKVLEQRRDCMMKGAQSLYVNHSEFLRKNGITLDQREQRIKLTEMKAERLLADLDKMIHHKWKKYIEGDDEMVKGSAFKITDKSIRRFRDEGFRKFSDVLFEELYNKLRRKVECMSRDGVLEEHQLPSLRSCYISLFSTHWQAKVAPIIKEAFELDVGDEDGDKFLRIFTSDMIQAFFEGCVETGLIQFFGIKDNDMSPLVFF